MSKPSSQGGRWRLPKNCPICFWCDLRCPKGPPSHPRQQRLGADPLICLWPRAVAKLRVCFQGSPHIEGPLRHREGTPPLRRCTSPAVEGRITPLGHRRAAKSEMRCLKPPQKRGQEVTCGLDLCHLAAAPNMRAESKALIAKAISRSAAESR